MRPIQSVATPHATCPLPKVGLQVFVLVRAKVRVRVCFKVEFGVASAGSVLVLRGAWCGVRSDNYFRRVTRNFRWLVGRVRLCTRLKEHEQPQAKTHRKSTNAKPTASKAALTSEFAGCVWN